MHKPLSYEELYQIAEELAHLARSQSMLQSARGVGSTGFCLQFYDRDRGGRTVLLDLTPTRPFIVSTRLAIPLKKTKVSPVQNFLQAHFKGLVLSSVEMAQKPNRTLKFQFVGDHETTATLEFQCYPHGQKIILKAGDKHVVLPRHGRASDENVTFVEVDPPMEETWTHNEDFFSTLNFQTSTKPSEPKENKQKAKFKRSIEKMEANKEAFFKNTQEKILHLEALAQEIKSGEPTPSKGIKLQKTYQDIKKLKRGLLEFGERKKHLAGLLETQSNTPTLPDPIDLAPTHKRFSGTSVEIDKSWSLWVGRKAQQNDELLRLGSPHDLWIHMRDFPGAHGLLRGPRGKVPAQETLEFACRIVAYFSQNKKSPFQEGEVLEFIVTPKKFVKKKKGLAPGRVIVEREKVRRIAFKTVAFLSS